VTVWYLLFQAGKDTTALSENNKSSLERVLETYEPLPPLEPIIDPTGTPIAGSFTGLCEECREPYFVLADDGAQ